MTPWKINFAPKRETFTSVPIWVRLYSLPLDYWQPESLAAIGNKIGKFIKASEASRRGRCSQFLQYIVKMDLLGALPDEVILEFFDEEWVQMVDYEHILFRCHRCHEHGHLLRDCPLGKIENKRKPNTMKDLEGFHKVVHKGKSGKKGQRTQHKEGSQGRWNQFQLLEENDDKIAENQANEGSTGEKEKE